MLQTKDMSSNGKTVLITGAGKGIGSETAKKYLKEGYNVICHYHTEKPYIDGVKLIKGEFANETGVEEFIKRFQSLECEVDVLINNAASFFIADKWELINKSQIDEVFHVNFQAPLQLIQFFIKLMIKKKWGRIVNISSISVEHGGNPASLAYTTSKAALEAMTKSLSKSTANLGVLINAIRVGLTDTEFHKKNPSKSISDRVKQIPMGRMAKPDEIANTIFFYGSDHNTFTTGSILKISGGE
ncbi:SDR family oxidoreductase [bacterium]|nr:SDR family oxidoreductase [bacterium]